ncbi:hypothetical protein TCDM_10509 [Trypanosoma cruzi Dm28c]|uniref:Uncharacterized protein n=1 Tax=Trypanosoma cruzi Dm28c TaxID=1416333 RepID=V5B771_TRYCR|nr:hypothetical protein TCDM_10509 [Trypanosoma cruzi Dm28c]
MLMTTALCASPAARMRRGRDERRAEGAVTCGRATRACGAAHTFLSLLFFYCGQGGQTPAAPHTHPHTPPCLSVGVIAAAAWCTAAAVGVLERDEAPNEQKRPHPLDEIKMADESCFVAFASFIAKNAACRCPTGCLHSAPFEALRSFIQCDATIIMATSSLNGSECDNTNDGKNSDEDDDGLHRGADYLRVFLHESQEGLNAVPTIPGLAEPLAFALSPAVISAPCVEADPFAVEFTQQLSSGCAAVPALALSHVSQCCLACDLMSVLSRPLTPVFCCAQ